MPISFSAGTGCLLLVLLLAACGESAAFNERQQGVYDAMQAWTAAGEARDPAAMWELLSPDAKDFYIRELTTGPASVRSVYRQHKEALAPDSMISESWRREIEEDLAKLPPDPESMTAKEYYAWRISAEFTPAEIINQRKLFARENIVDIEIDGERATVILKHGKSTRYSWRFHESGWKFDLSPARLRQLEADRRGDIR